MARVPCLVLCAVAASFACTDGLGPIRERAAPSPDGKPALLTPGPRSPRLANYQIAARYDAGAHRLEGRQTLRWTNGSGVSVDRLPFHLYLNGFKNESTLFMKSSRGRHRGVAATGDGWGWIEVTSIKLGADELRGRSTFVGPDETVLEVPLPAPVAPGASIDLDLTFTSQLPRALARTGYEGAFTMVAQWFPKIGVLVGARGFERWECPPFHVNTEFFADFGVYDVDLTVPTTHVVAATGVLTAVEEHDDRTRTLRYRAEDVHDFAWMIDPYMQVLVGTAQVGGQPVEVRVVHRPRQRGFARRHLQAAIGAVETFSQLFVPYPWSIMTVVDPPPEAAAASGMEYPTLVTTAADNVLMRPGVRIPEYVTIHEVGHNWFQGILASNEFQEAWLDEGINSWADGVVMDLLYGGKRSGVAWGGWEANGGRLQRVVAGDLGAVPSPIASSAAAFVDNDAYGIATYTKTAAAIDSLAATVGRDRFALAMRDYATAWAFKHPTGTDLWHSLETSLGQDLDWFVQPTFQRTGGLDVAVRTIDCREHRPPRGVFGEGDARRTVTAASEPPSDIGGYDCEVVVVNRGTIAMPIDLELRFADGTVDRMRWDARDGSRWHRLTLTRSSPIAEVELDPDGALPLADHTLDDHVRVRGDSRAATRAAARVTTWTQTLMQVVGL